MGVDILSGFSRQGSRDRRLCERKGKRGPSLNNPFLDLREITEGRGHEITVKCGLMGKFVTLTDCEDPNSLVVKREWKCPEACELFPEKKIPLKERGNKPPIVTQRVSVALVEPSTCGCLGWREGYDLHPTWGVTRCSLLPFGESDELITKHI